ncbi:gamma-glutamyl-gamma-aminobutyrate hydrolase PuuD [Bradyrhizobium sp. GM0.4]
MLSRPRIGITPDINDLDASETEYVMRRNYADAVLTAGGLPFILPYTDNVGIYLADADGLLITGGRFDSVSCHSPIGFRQSPCILLSISEN